jgi:hypothetical protein
VEALGDDDEALPDVLTVYLSGTDLFAHVATQGPEEARRIYLARALEPRFAKLHRALAERGALDDRFTVLVSDHGHTQVIHDDAHALATSFESDPPAVLARSGLRVRPFALELNEGQEDFQAVLAYQGAMAFVYLADRSTCASPGQRCDWTRPPRYREDVLVVAEAFHRANRTGALVPEMKGVLDLVLARRPRPHHEVDEPFRVYVGGGRLVRLETWLRQHPHPRYVRLAERMADLAAGPAGERAGDVLLVAHNGDRDTPEERFYFASRHRSWHGSPSRQDGEIPLIVAHPKRSSAELRALVDGVVRGRASQQQVADLLLALRYGSAGEPAQAASRRSSVAR